MMYNVTYSTRICDVCDIRAYLTWSDSPICKKIKCQFSAIIAQLYQSLPCTTSFNSNMSMQWRSMQSAKILFRRISKRRFVECRGARFHAVWLLSNEQLLQSLTNSALLRPLVLFLAKRRSSRHTTLQLGLRFCRCIKPCSSLCHHL
jgi:hypothetical protein